MKIVTRLFLILVVLTFAGKVFCQKLYQWRGDNREGIYNESNLLKEWPEDGPKLLWFNETIGAGFAAPVVTNDKVLVNGEINNTACLFAFDLKGNLLWKSSNGKEYEGIGYGTNFPGARSTPTVAGDLVYSVSGVGRIGCYEIASGKEKWSVDMMKDLGGAEEEFGIAESPLIDGDFLYCFPGGHSTNFAALNRFSGKTMWTSKALGDTTSFCSPTLINLPARKIMVTMSRHYLLGIDVKNGELLWSHKIENYKYDGDHCNTPVYADECIFYTTQEENGNGLVKLRLSPDGKNIQEIWRNPEAKNAFGGFVKVGNTIFMTNDKKVLLAVDSETGKVISSLRPNSGSLIYADNRIYCYNDNGDMKLIKYENGQLTEVGKFKVTRGTKEHFAHPVIANGVLYIRHGNALMAYAIK